MDRLTPRTSIFSPLRVARALMMLRQGANFGSVILPPIAPTEDFRGKSHGSKGHAWPKSRKYHKRLRDRRAA